MRIALGVGLRLGIVEVPEVPQDGSTITISEGQVIEGHNLFYETYVGRQIHLVRKGETPCNGKSLPYFHERRLAQ